MQAKTMSSHMSTTISLPVFLLTATATESTWPTGAAASLPAPPPPPSCVAPQLVATHTINGYGQHLILKTWQTDVHLHGLVVTTPHAACSKSWHLVRLGLPICKNNTRPLRFESALDLYSTKLTYLFSFVFFLSQNSLNNREEKKLINLLLVAAWTNFFFWKIQPELAFQL